jgi:hypothetical protein
MNEKFLEVSEPFFKKVLTRRRQQAAAPYSRSWSFPTFKYHLRPNRVNAPHGGCNYWPLENETMFMVYLGGKK